MKYIFDTDSVSFLFGENRNEHERLHQKFSSLSDADVVCVSFATIFELEYSYSNAKEDEKKQEIRVTIENTKQRFQIIPLKLEFAPKYGEVKAKLKNHWGSSSKGMRKHNLDLMIACTALSASCVLVSHDDIYQEVQKVFPSFQFEDWAI